MSQTTHLNRMVVRAGTHVALGNLFVTFANLGRDVAIAAAFGTALSVDAFFLSIMLPIFALTVGTGAYRSTVIPVLQKVLRNAGVQGVRRVVSRLLTVNVIVVLVVGGLIAALVPLYAPALAGRLPEGATHAVTVLSWATLPMLLVSGYAALTEGPLQSQGRYFLPGVTRVGLPVGIAFGALFLGPQLGLLGACLGGLIGACLQLVAASALLSREKLFKFTRAPLDAELACQIRAQFAALSAGVSIAYISPVVNQWMASWLGAGAVSTLSFASRLAIGAAALTTGSLGPALLPHFSRLAAQDNPKSVQAHYLAVMRITAWAGFAVAGVIWLAARPVVVFLYEGGRFTREDTAAVSIVLEWLCLQFPPLLMGTAATSLLSALQRNRVFLPLSVAIALVNATGNFVLMPFLGLPGIALTTGITYVVSLTIMNTYLMGNRIVRLPWQFFFELSLALTIAGALALALVLLDGKPGYQPTFRQLTLSFGALCVYGGIAYGFTRKTIWRIIGS